jgi:transcriptional regulator with XRE-family HTH domain
MATKKSNNPAISDWVRTARKSKKLTQKDLAVKLKISKRSLENYESGVVDVPTATAIGVYEICKVIPPFFDPQLVGSDQSKDAKEDKTVEDEGEEVTAKYISLLEANIRKLEIENEDLKAYINKSSTKPKATKKK